MSVETAHALQVRGRTADSDGGSGDASSDGGPVWVGVVRSPPGWFQRRVDVHVPALGLADETRDALDRRRRDLQMRGLCAEGAHNAAWVELAVDGRYQTHLSSDDAQRALDTLAARREDIVLATDRRPGFRCHRTPLAAVLDDE